MILLSSKKINNFLVLHNDCFTGPAVNNLIAASNASDGFLCKLDSSGNYLWAFSICSTGQEYIKSMTVDSVGNIYCVGNFQNTIDFDPGSGTALSTANGFNSDSYVVKLNSFDGTYVSHIVFGGACMDARLLHEF